MRVLVMGGSRFIGLHVVHQLIERGHQVTVLNRGNNNENLPQGVDILVADRKDKGSLRAALANHCFDAVIDMCAYTLSDTQILLDILPSHIRFIHCSTGSVYKDTVKAPITEDYPIGGDGIEGSYGTDKYHIEAFLFEKYEKEGFPMTLIRPGYVYGPDNYLYRERRFFERLEKGRPILIPGRGETLTQCVYVKDLAKIFAICLEKPVSIGQAYNMMQLESYTLKGYMEAIFTAAGKRTQVVTFEPERMGYTVSDMTKVFPFRWIDNTVRSIAKAQRDLDFAPTSLEEGMAETYQWWLEHGAWYEENLEIEDDILAKLTNK